MIRTAIHENKKLRRVASIDLEPDGVLRRTLRESESGGLKEADD
jgi:hypothetical protein